MAGVDGYDWSVFGGNPAPGDPDGVRAIARRLRDLADEVHHQNQLLRSVGSDSHAVWVGPAGDAFRPHLDKLPAQLTKLTTSYRDAADALDGYWPRLAAAQQQAVEAWHKAQAAQSQVQSAQAQVSAADQAATTAAGSYNQAVTTALAAPPDPTGAALVHLSTLQTAYQNASNQLAAANSALGAANTNLQAAHAQADSARSQAKAAARHVATGLHHASKVGIHNPHHSLWGSVVDDVKGAAGDVVHFAEHRAGDVMHAADGGLHWVEHHAGDIATAASLALGPAGLLLTSEGRHLVSEALHAAEPGLIVASEVLGATSAVLAVAGMALAPVGIGEAIDAVNEGVIGLKTIDDAALVAAGDQSAQAALIADGVALGTLGTSELLSEGGEAATAVSETSQTATEASAETSGEAAANGAAETSATGAGAVGTASGGGSVGTAAGEGVSSSESSGQTFVHTPQGATYDIPEGWVSRTADNGKGIVFQEPGAVGDANSIRIMEPTADYPNGYVRYYNEMGQPLDVYGKPGPRSATHIPQDYQGPWPGWP